MADVNWQQVSTLGGVKALGAATAIIRPTTFLTVFTAGVAVQTIFPPVSTVHMLALEFADAAGLTNGGNINIGAPVASVANRPMLLIYNPTTALYQVVTVA